MLKVFNTLGRDLQTFKPLERKKVKMYQCGPTVYSRQHIGNMLSVVKIDLIRRSLEYLGYKVIHTRNITDVGHLLGDNEGDADQGEDRMAKGAKRENLTPEQIAKKYTNLYHKDVSALNALEPTYETPATSYINQMAQMVQELINKGYAYATQYGIYFEVDKFPKYNELNMQKLEKNIEGKGHGDHDETGKKKPYDFAIWFFKTGNHENALQTWKYKFEGIEQKILEGFPGWHIECSAMAKDTLGETIDIHFGGTEHISIHHTNEIAQSESANNATFSNYWLHLEHLLIDGGKMSKSLGNVYSLDDVIEKGFDPMDFRYFLLGSHYRSKQNFTWEALEAARNARRKMVDLALVWSENQNAKNVDIEENYKAKFVDALENDFNIPKALAVFWEMAKSDSLEAEKKLATLMDFDKVFGLRIDENIKSQNDPVINSEISRLLKERDLAKLQGNFQKADQIRDLLKTDHKVLVEDTPDGSVVKRM